MTAHLLNREGREEPRVDSTTVEARLAGGHFFWLDLHAPGPGEIALLRDVFAFHPLAVEDSEHFGQRSKVEPYGDFVFLVLYGAAPAPDEDRLVEVHCFYSERYLVTIRQDEAPACDALRARYRRHPAPLERPVVLLYRLLDALVDSFFPALDDLDEHLESLEEEAFEGREHERLSEALALRRRVVGLRRAAAPQRDLLGMLAGGALDLPGLDTEARRYFRDVHDHLLRITEQLDVDRELLSGAVDVYLSSASNRLNASMKQLTVIATIFLPLTFVTGFFGQNFDWMTERVGSLGAFVVLGVGLQLVALGALVVLFRRRGWFT